MAEAIQNPTIPGWQRAVCGVLAVGGVVATAITAWAFFSAAASYASAIEALLFVMGAAWGTFLFGYAALKGKLPIKFM